MSSTGDKPKSKKSMLKTGIHGRDEPWLDRVAAVPRDETAVNVGKKKMGEVICDDQSWTF